MAVKPYDSVVIVKELYPLIESSLKKNENKFIKALGKFFIDRHEQLFDIAPYDNIYHNQKDVDDMFNSLGIKEKDVLDILKKMAFWNDPYNPKATKEPYIETLMCAIRYFKKQKDEKNVEIVATYLAFSGKIYASIYSYDAFPKASPSAHREVMDYVINNMLTDKYKLKTEGNLFNAVKATCKTWTDMYDDVFRDNDATDDEYGKKLVQQIRDRIRSFLMNIAKLYYEVYEKKLYMNYETDSIDPEEFHLTDNDAAVAARTVENTMQYMTSTTVSLDICNKAKNENVPALELKDIIETILSDKNNLDEVRRVLSIIVGDYMKNNPGKRLGNPHFISYTMKPKPNTKDPLLNELKSTIVKWLDENSPAYRKRKNRPATASNYFKSILLYFTLVICKVVNK